MFRYTLWGGGRLSELSAFHHQYDALHQGILARGVVLFLQAGAEECGKGLVESGFEGSHEGTYQLEGCLVIFSVYQFDEQFALSKGEFLHAGRVLFFQSLFHGFDVSAARFLVGQSLQEFVSLDDDAVDFLGDGQGLFHVAYQLVVFGLRTPVLEFQWLENVDGGQLHVGDGVALVDAHRRQVDALLSGRRRSLLRVGGGCTPQQQQQKDDYVAPLVHTGKNTASL